MLKRLMVILYAILVLASTFVVSPLAALSQEAKTTCQMDEARASALKQAARGLFSHLVFIEEPYYAGDLSFRNAAGETLTLAQFEGKILVLNMWAMWCAPCRAEMADLAHLAQKAGDENFDIIAVNMDQGGVDNQQIDEFLEQVNASNLTLYRDETMDIFKQVRRNLPARGLPFTLILDRQGCGVASLSGAAPWGNEDGLHFIETLKKQTISF